MTYRYILILGISMVMSGNIGASALEVPLPTSNLSVSENESTAATPTQSATGWLNVFTDIPDALIFVDGQEIGKESIVKLALDPGEHYVQVKVGQLTAYAQKAQLIPNRTTTIVSDHFVDFITKTPSRGAIDREARRLRESRGNLGLGIMGMAIPQPAASIKWWTTTNWGVQGLVLGEVPDTQYGGVLGGRILFSPGDKVFADDVTHGYVFVGGGQLLAAGDIPSSRYYEFGLGVEAKLGTLAQQLFALKYWITNQTTYGEAKADGGDFIRDAFFVGALSLFYTSLEINMVDRGNGNLETGGVVGLHVYF